MQGNHLYEYAIIRVVPRVEREEFLNVGVILYCRKPAFLQTKFLLDKDRLIAAFPILNIEDLEEHLHSFEQIGEGNKNAGPIALLDMASRFRWLTAKRSTIIQSSAIHPGLCCNPFETLEHLFQQQILV